MCVSIQGHTCQCRHTHACSPGCTRHYSWHVCPCIDTHMHTVLAVPDTTPGTCVLVSTHTCMQSWLYQTLLLARVSLCRHTHAYSPGCTRHYSWHVCPCIDTHMHAVLAVPDTTPGTCVLVSTHTCMLSWLYRTLLLACVSLCRHTHACSPGCTRHYSWHVCPCVDTHMHTVLAVPDTTPGTCVLVSTHTCIQSWLYQTLLLARVSLYRHTHACSPGCTRHYSWHVCPCIDTHMHAVLAVPDTTPGMCVLVSTHTCMQSWLYQTLLLACVSLCRHTHAYSPGCTRHYSWHVCPCVDTHTCMLSWLYQTLLLARVSLYRHTHMHAVLAVPDTTPGTCVLVSTHTHACCPGCTRHYSWHVCPCVDTHMHAVLAVPDTTPGTCVLVSTHTHACCPGCTRHYSWHVCPCVDTHTCMLSWLYQTLLLARVSLCRHTHACSPGCTRHYSWHVCPCIDTHTCMLSWLYQTLLLARVSLCRHTHMHAVLAVPDTTPGTCVLVSTHTHACSPGCTRHYSWHVCPCIDTHTCMLSWLYQTLLLARVSLCRHTHMHAVLAVPDTTPGTCVLVSTHTCMQSWLYQTLLLARVSLYRHTHACCPGCTRHYSWHVCPCIDTHMHTVLVVPDTNPGTCVLVSTHTCIQSWLYQTLILARVSLYRHTHAYSPGCTRH